jgi:hypothetical protein
VNRRAELLNRLAEFREPPDPLLAELRTFPFDWNDAPLLVLSCDHFRRVLGRFLSGDITSAQLQDWAECLETRDDVAFDLDHAELLGDLQFRLANPTINGALTHALARGMLAELAAATSNYRLERP